MFARCVQKDDLQIQAGSHCPFDEFILCLGITHQLNEILENEFQANFLLNLT